MYNYVRQQMLIRFIVTISRNIQILNPYVLHMKLM